MTTIDTQRQKLVELVNTLFEAMRDKRTARSTGTDKPFCPIMRAAGLT
ncbi:MAG: hypothetical protein ABFD81_02365 [Syntrophaceae bacterium]